MKNERMINSWNKVNPEQAAQEHMLRNILMASDPQRTRRYYLKKYVPIVACMVIILVLLAAWPKALRTNMPSMPNTEMTDKGSMPIPSKTENNQDLQIATVPLHFNQTDWEIEDKKSIPLHFWNTLTDSQLQKVFHSLVKEYTIEATANYNGSNLSLFNIEARLASLHTDKDLHVLIARDAPPTMCYAFNTETKTTDVYGVEVMAGTFEEIGMTVYFASWTTGGVGYSVELSGGEAAKEELTEVVSRLVYDGGADLSVFANPKAPELRDDRLSLEEVRSDVKFGKYFPQEIPSRFIFDNATRFVNQARDSLSAFWYKGMGHITWQASVITDTERENITTVKDKENYDLSLYSIPYADSVPDDLRQIVNNPIFLAEEMTLNVIKARAVYSEDDAGDEPGYRIKFGVLYDDVLVDISVKNVTPDAVWNMLLSLGL